MKGGLGNIVGPQIRKLRYSRGWSQAKLAVKLQLVGFDISRESLAKVEIQIHNVEDYQLPYYARALDVTLDQLYPPLPSNQPIHDVVARLRAKRNGTQKPSSVVSSHSIEQKKQMTLPFVQIRAEAK